MHSKETHKQTCTHTHKTNECMHAYTGREQTQSPAHRCFIEQLTLLVKADQNVCFILMLLFYCACTVCMNKMIIVC